KLCKARARYEQRGDERSDHLDSLRTTFSRISAIRSTEDSRLESWRRRPARRSRSGEVGSCGRAKDGMLGGPGSEQGARKPSYSSCERRKTTMRSRRLMMGTDLSGFAEQVTNRSDGIAVDLDGHRAFQDFYAHHHPPAVLFPQQNAADAL